MPKYFNENQLTLPFEIDRETEIFILFEPKLKDWHQFQDINNSKTGEYFWWRSRYSEWIHEMRKKWTFDEYIDNDKLFPKIWLKFSANITRGHSRGLPKDAH